MISRKTKKELTEEQKELFSLFPSSTGYGSQDQIRQVLLGAKTSTGNSVTSLAGNILIQGEDSEVVKPGICHKPDQSNSERNRK
ncbi:MAG: hypothetical protein ACLUD0_06925 [Eubacterium ramulus]